MTLTEQWKKGELPEGEYYIQSDWCDGIEIRYVHNNSGDMYDEILAPVPTYEEYQALLSNQLAKNEGVEINAELEKDLGIAHSTCDYIFNEKEKAVNDCKTVAQTLLKVSPEHREWLETNFKEYL